MTTDQIRTLADDLDTTVANITALAGQLSDDPNLWDDTTSTLTPAGVDLIRDQMQAGVEGAALDELAIATVDLADAENAATEARGDRDAAIVHAARAGATKTRIADVAGVSREYVHRVLRQSNTNA